MLLLTPRSYSEKPPGLTVINWAHPLTEGLSRVWLFTDAGRLKASDLVRGDILTHERNQADVGQVVGPMGVEFQSGADGGGTGFVGTLDSGMGATGCTIAMRWRPHTTNGFFEGSVNGLALLDGATNYPRLYYSSSLIHWNASGSGIDVGANANIGPTAGVNYTLVASYQRDTSIATYAGIWSLLIHGPSAQFGIYQNNSAVSTFAGTFDTGKVWRFGDMPTIGTSSHMFFGHIYVWNRGLTPTEMVDVAVRPYQFLQQSRGASWSAKSSVVARLFLPSNLTGLGSGGPFFQDPLGR